MPRINFHQQLAALKDKLLAMAALSQQALEFSVEAYLERDMALCDHVLEIGTAAIAKEGTDITVVAYSRAAAIAVDVARRLEEEERSLSARGADPPVLLPAGRRRRGPPEEA